MVPVPITSTGGDWDSGGGFGGGRDGGGRDGGEEMVEIEMVWWG